MAMGQQKDRQGDLMVSWSEMPRSPGRDRGVPCMGDVGGRGGRYSETWPVWRDMAAGYRDPTRRGELGDLRRRAVFRPNPGT